MNEYHQPAEVSFYRALQRNVTELKNHAAAFGLCVIINILLLYLCQNFLAGFIYEMAWMTGLHLMGDEFLWELTSTITYVIAFLLPYLGYMLATRTKASEVFPRSHNSGGTLTACVGSALGLSVFGIISSTAIITILSLFGLSPTPLDFAIPIHPAAFLLFLFNTTLLPAVLEEFIYRGIIMGSLRKFGDAFAIITSALFFALLHRNFYQLSNAFLLGLLLGYFVIKTGSLFTSILIHFVNNTLAVTADCLLTGSSDEVYMRFNIMLMLVYLLVGLIGIVYLAVRKPFDFNILPSASPVSAQYGVRLFYTSFPLILSLLLLFWVTSLSLMRM